MRRELDVYLHDRCVGQYIQNESGLSEFTYDGAYLSEPGAVPLSQSLPLRPSSFVNAECRGFFAGILPEGEKREIIAKNLGISAHNDFSMLYRIGGECAGAITFITPGVQPSGVEHAYLDVSGSKLEAILNELPARPLLAGKAGIRLSLAGAQDKLAVYITGGQISLPLGNTPSTHILKPMNSRYEAMVENEAFCMTLAKQLGMYVADVQIRTEGDKKFLLVKRYDRTESDNPDSRPQRLHQEDFCQAFGIVPEKKYQEEGGVSLKQCFDLLREVSAVPLVDLQRMLDAVIFNFLIGNHDAHGKNFSLLYTASDVGQMTRLAPLYDLICTTAYPDLSRNMAMSIGGKYKSASIKIEHFESMAEETGLAKPLVLQRIKAMAAAVLDQLDKTDYLPSPAQRFIDIIRSNAVASRAQYDKLNTTKK